MMNNSKEQGDKGFTLIELITAVSVFIIIMFISVGSIINVFDANRKARTLKSTVTNLNVAIESMSREMRFGRNYHCGSSGQPTSPQNCAGGDNLFTFLSSDNEQITYTLDNQGIDKDIDGAGFLAITGRDIVIDDLTFYTLGAGTGDALQPKIIMIIKSHAGEGNDRTDFTLQTMVSQRALDI